MDGIAGFALESLGRQFEEPRDQQTDREAGHDDHQHRRADPLGQLRNRDQYIENLQQEPGGNDIEHRNTRDIPAFEFFE